MNFRKISWEKYEKDCLILAKKIKSTKLRFDKIVAISRGGLAAARIFSDLLELPISHITIESYKDLKQKKQTRITEIPKKSFDNKKLLLIDEIADSGKTFKRAVGYYKRFKNCDIYTLALYIKPITNPLPDFWQERFDGWIIFPYEIRETYHAFVKMFKSPQAAKKKMIEVGFKEWEIYEI